MKRNKCLIKESNVIRDYIEWSLKDRNIKVCDVSKKFGVDNSRLYRYINGKPGIYISQEKILEILNWLGMDIEINIKPYDKR